jgi:hypothetical protein
LLIPTTKQHDAEQLGAIPGKRLNLTTAGARLVACEEAACKGPCNAELLSHYGKRLSCGPNGGVCASAKWFSDAAELNINSGGSETDPPNVCLFYDGYGDGGFAVGFLAESEVDLAGFKLKAKYGAIDAAGQYMYSAAQVSESELECDCKGHVINIVASHYDAWSSLSWQGGGVMGLAFPGAMDCSDFSCFPSLFNTLVAKRKSRVRDVFAICGGYKEEVTINEGAAPPPVAPLLLLGGGDLRLCASKIKWVPMVEPFDKYHVDAMDVKVGAGANVTSLGQGNKLPAMIIATGTNDVYVPTSVYEGFKAHLQTNYCHIHNVCGPTKYTIFDGRGLEDPESDFTGLPSLHIMLNETSNFALELSPRQYMRRFYHEETGKVYHHLRIHPEKSDRFVIGEVLLSKYYLEFDRVKRRMGFAISVTDCAGAIGH